MLGRLIPCCFPPVKEDPRAEIEVECRQRGEPVQLREHGDEGDLDASVQDAVGYNE